jgi:hypothetical protein
MFANGQSFKPNDLGLLRLNGEIFSYAPNPAIGLAAPLSIHAIFRPYLNKMFDNQAEWSVDTFKTEATTLLANKRAAGELTQSHIADWCQQMLHKYGLQDDITEAEASAMSSYTKAALARSILPFEVMIDPLKEKLNTTGVRTQNALYIAKYKDIVKARFPELTDDEAGHVSHILIDGALTFAGGLSVPGTITSMLGILYSGVHGDFTAYDTYSSAAYAWETVRLYPAVVGVPFVATGKTRREDLMLPAALTDKKAWGDDAFDFKLRTKTEYEKIDVAWSGFTKDPKFPNEDHSCPGMAMSKAIMLGFMEAFVYSQWEASETPKQMTKAPVGWNSFSLTPSAGAGLIEMSGAVVV